MSFALFLRRLHVYLALILLPWVLMYAVSALVINHNQSIKAFLDDGKPDWSERTTEAFNEPIPGDDELQEFGRNLAKQLGLEGGYYTYRSGSGRINVNVQDFWSNHRVIYDSQAGTARVEDQRFQWNGFLIRMHERSGYLQESFLHDLWAVLVDVTCGAYLVLTLTGLWMWWSLKRCRWTGALAILSGLATYVGLIWIQ